MACAGCGLETSADFAFCPRCGRRLPAPCTACGAPCEPDFAFCPRCGAARSPAAVGADKAAAAAAVVQSDGREADRRRVTVLFADLSGFTSLSERLDPEEVRAFQNALFETLAQAIERYDGFVEKFVGDAVMAVFGAPVAHEDDPQRALEAALQMLERGGALSERWAARLGQRVLLHIGVHSGPVVAGSLGAAAGAAYAVTGDTVNTTARLLAAAAPGTILVSEATHALTRHRFSFEPAGELTLRGKSEPVVVHRLLGTLAEPRSGRGLAALGLAAPLVGRADELDQLMKAFARMARGRAQMVSLVGEAGTGKSRLLSEFFARLEAEGQLREMAVRRVTCSSLGEPTYGIFGALFREAYKVDPADSLDVAREKLSNGLMALGARADEAAAIAPVLSYVLGVEDAKPRDFEPEQLHRQIALAARALVERRLQHEPLLIVVDDLHWADSASVDLLRSIVDHLAERPLMVLLSHRPEARPPLVTRATQLIIRVHPLSADETRSLVGGLFGAAVGEPLTRLQDFVATRAGGNPLFVEEIVRSLVGTGVLVHDGDRWASTAAYEAVDVPATLHGLLLSRVDRLPAEARRLLQEAAVLGAEFEEPLLRDIATDAGAIHAALDRLTDADLIQSAGSGRDGTRYRFTHALVHEVVYQNLLLSRRTELHETAGRALERVTGPHPERLSDLEALGHHWSLSADKPRGARYLLAAGDWARAVYANDDAIRHYERALRTLAECQACAIETWAPRERLADLQGLTGRRAEALAHYESVRQETETAGDRAAAARLHRKIGALHWEAGDRERAGACFASGLDRLGDDGDPLERAHLFQEMGRLAFRAGDNAGAIEWAERALAEAASEEQTSTDPERSREAAAMRAQAYNTLGVALARTGRLTEAVAQIERSIGLAEARDLLQAACRGYTNLGVLYSSLDPRRSIETCLRGLETAKKVGDLGFQSRLYANLAVAYCALTDRCEAEGVEAARAAIDLDRRLGLLDHLAVPLIVLGQIHQCHGEHAEAFASYQEALDLAEQVGEPQLLFPCYDGLATLHLDAGNQALAETYLAKAQKVCEQAGLEPDALMVLPFLC
ncbi:MAG: adenylate/guanylate cyclase domain-containing protein [Candidatus Rokuibacteriota bacterium]|nr:MAG: adenylate/guanylate cyclase domain-containing protein [Candidatus Rokubacteria bacterium]